MNSEDTGVGEKAEQQALSDTDDDGINLCQTSLKIIWHCKIACTHTMTQQFYFQINPKNSYTSSSKHV